MALQAKLVQKLGQSLLMTPQLQKAIKLLQLGRTEFVEAIHQELLENPVLEESKEDDERGSLDMGANAQEEQERQEAHGEDNKSSPVSYEDYLSSFSDASGVASPKSQHDTNERPSLEMTLTREETLQEHLLSQLRLVELEGEKPIEIALHIIGNLDRNGYLCCSYEEIAKECSCREEDIAEVIEAFKSLDPVGVGARNLQECLLFQLESEGLESSLEARIIAQHLDKLERRKYEEISKAEKVSLEQVHAAILRIQALEPRPGRPFLDDATRYITPDIYVNKINGEWVITLNEEGLPRLRVSPTYLEMLKKGGSEQNRTYLNDRLKAASWLIKSIHQRQQTIYKVTESIVKFQQEFLDQGISKLKPLVLKDVADDIGMHESTVSRVTTNKFVHTPQGVFELKFFFTTGIKSGDGEVSSSAIKERIRAIIASESPDAPISDQKIVEILVSEGTEIARRTVAKYREGLGILSSSKRKNPF